jgi:hypothetical protein
MAVLRWLSVCALVVLVAATPIALDPAPSPRVDRKQFYILQSHGARGSTLQLSLIVVDTRGAAEEVLADSVVAPASRSLRGSSQLT